MKTELTVMFSVTAANVDEKSEMSRLLESMPDWLKERAQTIAPDQGHDSIELTRIIKAAGIAPIVVDIRAQLLDGQRTAQTV
ncbi:MAG: hypothetical protein FWH55_05180 [Oscillospiraceae bacterium]|nr:hypothetical protein [Oscillospiraceae bacterium]